MKKSNFKGMFPTKYAMMSRHWQDSCEFSSPQAEFMVKNKKKKETNS